MKILKLTLENITSLADRYIIDFEHGPLADAGLFAIVGPTGAGKTTILDAICLALYGCGSKGGDRLGYMSHGKTYAMAEVAFEAEQKRYIARWTAETKRVNIAQKLELGFLDDGKIIVSENTDNKKHREAIERVTKLSYEQFTRSILLPQGQFSQFLLSPEEEKGRLLTQLTNSGIYDRISAKVKGLLDQQRGELHQLELAMNNIRPFTEEELRIKQEELADAKAQLQVLTQQWEKVQQQLAWYATLAQLNVRLQAQEQQLQSATTAASEWPHAQRYDLHLQAQPFKDGHDEWQDAKKIHRNLDQELQELNTTLATKEEFLATQMATRLQHETALAAQDELIAQKEPVWQQVTQTENALTEQRKASQAHKLKQNAAHAELEKATAQVNQLKGQQQALDLQIRQVSDYLSTHASHALLTQNLNHWQGLIQQYAAQHDLLQQAQNQVLQAKELLGKKEEAITLQKENLATVQQRDEEASQQLQVLKQHLQNMQHTYPNLGELLSQQEQNGQQVATLKGVFQNLQRQQAELGMVQTQLATNQQALATERQQLKSAQESLTHSEEKLALQEQLEKTEARVLSLEQHRASLQAGEDCPLCGSKEHPYADGLHVMPPNERLLRINELKAACQNLSKAVAASQTKVELLHLKLSQAEEAIPKLQEGMQQLSQQKQDLLAALQQPEELSEAAFTDWAQQQETRLQLLRSEYKQFNALRSQADSLAETAKAWTEKRNTLSLQLSEEMSGLGLLIQQLATHEKQSMELQASIKTLYASLEPIEQVTPLPQHLPEILALSHTLQQYHATYTQQQSQLQTLEQQANALKTQLASATTALQNAEAAKHNLLEEAKRLDEAVKSRKETMLHLLENHDWALLKTQPFKPSVASPDDEDFDYSLLGTVGNTLRKLAAQQQSHLRQLLNDAQQACNTTTTQITDYKTRISSTVQQKERAFSTLTNTYNSLSAQLAGSPFEAVETLTAAFLPSQQASLWAKEKQQLEQAVTAATALFAQCQEQLTAHAAAQPAQLAEEPQLQADAAALKEEREAMNATCITLGNLLREDAQRRQQFAAEMQRHASQQKVVDDWTLLYTVVGDPGHSRKTVALSKFAQMITLGFLTQMANAQLQQLNSRYSLRQVDGTLSLRIIDHDQADNERDIRSLSGGETFLTSLALALALSDLASNRTPIETLFIDEGFGTLDAETLDTAITTLENLRNTGKTVGIISHVDSLKERLSAQIEVSKMGSGRSKLTVKGLGVVV